jgi:hypothetical protein
VIGVKKGTPVKPLILAIASVSALIVLGSLSRASRPAGISKDGSLAEVVVFAPGPSLTLDEVVVRAGLTAAATAIPSIPAVLN